MAEATSIAFKDTTANPAPLGLCAFGMTTVLLNLHNAGCFKMDSMILGMGLCFGGAAQVVAGAMEWKKNNTFGLTAFSAYGFFWLSLVAIIVMQALNPAWQTDNNAMGAYLLLWGLFTLGLFIGTFRASRALQWVFGTLVILFFLLAIGHFSTRLGDGFEHFTGYEGIVCGGLAMYTGLALVVNEVHGKTILPVGAPTKTA